MVDADRSVVLTEHAVVIAGGGPTGLMLAGELALAGIDVVIVERRANQDVDGSRAGGLHSRTIEVLDQRGIAERFLSAGQVIQGAGFAFIALDLSDFPTRHNYILALFQSLFEPILAEWVGELGVPILREREVVGFTQDNTGVDVYQKSVYIVPSGGSATQMLPVLQRVARLGLFGPGRSLSGRGDPAAGSPVRGGHGGRSPDLRAARLRAVGRAPPRRGHRPIAPCGNARFHLGLAPPFGSFFGARPLPRGAWRGGRSSPVRARR